MFLSVEKATVYENSQNIIKILPETMTVDGDISGPTGPILFIFGQLGANIVKFQKSNIQLGTRIFQDVI